MVNRSARLEVILGLKDETKKGFDSAGQSLSGFKDKLNGMRVQLLAVAGASAGIAVASIKAASSLEEQMNSASATFKDAFKTVEEFADGTASAFNLSKRAAFQYTAELGGIFNASGLARDASAEMAVETTKLAADLASFKDIKLEDALQKIRAGLVGEAEPLRTVGVLLNAASVEAKAMEMGLADANGEISDGAKVQARYAIILDSLSDAQGDVARTGNTVAGQMRNVSQQVEDAAASLGTQLLPVAAAVLTKVAGLVGWFANLSEGTKTTILVIGGIVGGLAALGLAIPPIISGLTALRVVMMALSTANPLLLAFTAIVAGIALVIANWDTLKEVFNNAVNWFIDIANDLINTWLDIFINPLIDSINKIGEKFGVHVDNIELNLQRIEEASGTATQAVIGDNDAIIASNEEVVKSYEITARAFEQTVHGKILQAELERQAIEEVEKAKWEASVEWAEAIVAASEERYAKIREQREQDFQNWLAVMGYKDDAVQALIESNRAEFERIRSEVETWPSVISMGGSEDEKENTAGVKRDFKDSQNALMERMQDAARKVAALEKQIAGIGTEGSTAQLEIDLAAARRAYNALLEITQSDQFKGEELAKLLAPPGGYGSGPPPLVGQPPGERTDTWRPIGIGTQPYPTITVNVAGSLVSERELEGYVEDGIWTAASQSNGFNSFEIGSNNASSFN